jgi:hypothetical protein
MFLRFFFIAMLSLLIVSCGPAAPAATEAPAATDESVATEFPLIPENSPTAEPSQTFTPESTQTPAPTLTETPLPPLDIPTEVTNAPAKMVWDGAPTYPGDSQPGFAFRVTYDPTLWAVTIDQMGFPALGHRNIPYCAITPASGRGLPQNMNVEHDILYLDNVFYDVNTAYQDGVKKFVIYSGGDKIVFTGFEVIFQEQANECLADAVTVLSTLQSVPVSQATPSP